MANLPASTEVSNTENGIEELDANGNNSTNVSESAKPTCLPSKTSTRPTGIPKLFSAKSAGTYQPTRTRIPLTPGNENFCPPNSNTYSKSSSPDFSSARDQLISPIYNKRSRAYMQSISSEHSRQRNSTAQSLNRYDRAMSEENQPRKTSRDSSYSEMTNTSSVGYSGGVITSKIGSLKNVKHKPGGGKVEIVTKKVDFSNVSSKCGSTKNIKYQPGGGQVQIVNRKLDFSNVDSKCGSKKNIKHKPLGGDVTIFDEKLEFKECASSKVNSMKNVRHKPTGGDVKIENRKLEWKVESKVGSLNNVKHKPSGGHVKIVNEPLPWLKYNKPNLPPEEIAKINKRTSKDSIVSPSRSYSNSICSDRSS